MRRQVATHSFLNETVVAIWGENEGRQEGQVTRRGRSGEELLYEPARRDAERAGRIKVGKFPAAAQQKRLKPESQPNRPYKVFRLTRIITTPHTRAAPKQFQGPT